MPAVSRIFALVGFVLAPMPSRAFLSSDCPKVKPVPDLNITEFTRASWYVQEQQVTSYQSEDQLNCVVATYDAGKSGWWEPPLFFDGEVLSCTIHTKEEVPPSTTKGSPPADCARVSKMRRSLPSCWSLRAFCRSLLGESIGSSGLDPIHRANMSGPSSVVALQKTSMTMAVPQAPATSTAVCGFSVDRPFCRKPSWPKPRTY